MTNDPFFISIQTGVPTFATGEPGTSKTRTTEAFARYIGFEYECLIGSQHDPIDIGGLPRVTADGSAFSYIQPEWRQRLTSSERGGLLHLDELFDCPPAVQAAFLQILGDGLHNCWIVATGNPVDQSTNGFSLGAPVINRLCWLDWQTPLQSWKDGLLNGWDTISTQYPILPANWRSLIPQARAAVVSFLERAPQLAQALPENFQSDPAPYPSLRSWTHAATELAACWSLCAGEEVEDTLIAGCIGDAAAISFRKFLKARELADPEDLLRDPSLYKPEKLRGDIALQTLSAVVGAVLRNNTEERWLAAWSVIERQCDHAPDLAIASAGPLNNHKPLSQVRLGGVAPAQGAVVQMPDSVREKLHAVVG